MKQSSKLPSDGLFYDALEQILIQINIIKAKSDVAVGSISLKEYKNPKGKRHVHAVCRITTTLQSTADTEIDEFGNIVQTPK